MSDVDILADAKEWLADQRGDRIQTHGEICHRWHVDCLVSRLANEVQRLRLAICDKISELGEEMERTSQPHATPGEGTSQDECTNHDAAPTAGVSDRQCAGHADIGGTIPDAVPAARVRATDEDSLHAVSELGNPGAASRSGEVTGTTQEPVAWAVMANSKFVEACDTQDRAMLAVSRREGQMAMIDGVSCEPDGTPVEHEVVPLYRLPEPPSTPGEGTSQNGCTLTDEYRTALQKCVADKSADWKAACESAKLASQEINRLRLTRYERHCLKEVRDMYADEDDVACNEIAAVLDGLLERTK